MGKGYGLRKIMAISVRIANQVSLNVGFKVSHGKLQTCSLLCHLYPVS